MGGWVVGWVAGADGVGVVHRCFGNERDTAGTTKEEAAAAATQWHLYGGCRLKWIKITWHTEVMLTLIMLVMN